MDVSLFSFRNFTFKALVHCQICLLKCDIQKDNFFARILEFIVIGHIPFLNLDTHETDLNC